MALTQESVLSFLLERGGKVKNSELLNHFKSGINSNDPAQKQHNRDLFKNLVNSVAVVKQMEETKFVVVKRRYLDFIRDAPQCASQKAHLDDSNSSQNTSFSFASPPQRALSVKASDIENNNTCAINLNGNYVNDSVDKGSAQCEKVLSRSVSLDTTVRVFNIPGHQVKRAGNSGSVFAVVAVKSPPRTPAATQEELYQKTTGQSTSVTRVSPTPPPTAYFPAHKNYVFGGWGNRQAEDIQSTEIPQVRPQSKTSKQGEEARYSESVPLDPLAHEWLVKCAAGLWGQVYALLLQDVNLAQRKDFMSGFTVLHWAAKGGNCEIIRKIMDISRKRGAFINVNSKAHGGYTPLHIAAMHGHTKVLLLLVQGYGAKINERDNDGKKAFHYLGKSVSAEVRALLGALPLSKHREKKDEEYKKQTRNMHTMSKRFHSRKGKKRVAKYAQDW